MSTFPVPIPLNPPPWVSWRWTPTNAVLVVTCARCRQADALYTTVLHKNHDALAAAVEGHRSCAA